jgi:hypothetical protein
VIELSMDGCRFWILSAFHGSTRKLTLLVSVPLGVTTWTGPVVAPTGTVVLIAVCDSTVKVADVPLKVTLVVPARLVPKLEWLRVLRP